MARDNVFEVEDISRDLDLVVYRLERDPAPNTAWESERRDVRIELEKLRDRLVDLARGLE